MEEKEEEKDGEPLSVSPLPAKADVLPSIGEKADTLVKCDMSIAVLRPIESALGLLL